VPGEGKPKCSFYRKNDEFSKFGEMDVLCGFDYKKPESGFRFEKKVKKP
jgi:hypothetical protein